MKGYSFLISLLAFFSMEDHDKSSVLFGRFGPWDQDCAVILVEFLGFELIISVCSYLFIGEKMET